jgi:hypothetical protein
MTQLATIIDVLTLGKVILYSVIAGVGVSTTVGIAIAAVAGSNEARRSQRTAATAGYTALAAITIAATVATMLLAIVLMTRKG